MRITIMNASPKAENSATQQLIDRFIPFLKNEEYGILQVHAGMDENLALTAADLSDAWIIASPIYIDGLPSSMIALMDLLEAKAGKKGVKVGVILQCGFYEAENTEHTMELIRFWCERNDYIFLGGMGIGAGGALMNLKKSKTGSFFLKPLKPAYEALYHSLQSGTAETSYFSLAMPKRLYQWMAERQWKKAIQDQGLEARDLSYQPKDTNENVSKNI